MPRLTTWLLITRICYPRRWSAMFMGVCNTKFSGKRWDWITCWLGNYGSKFWHHWRQAPPRLDVCWCSHYLKNDFLEGKYWGFAWLGITARDRPFPRLCAIRPVGLVPRTCSRALSIYALSFHICSDGTIPHATRRFSAISQMFWFAKWMTVQDFPQRSKSHDWCKIGQVHIWFRRVD
jgi:hypothetical protein